MSSRVKPLTTNELGDLLMFLERVVPRGTAEADILHHLIGRVNSVIDSRATVTKTQ